METTDIILYDGVCGFCDWSVQFVLSRDTQGRFRFAALQSEAGAKLLVEHGLSESEALESLVVLHQGTLLRYSDAVVHILRHLPSWGMFGALIALVPRTVRDAGYRCIARHRYRLFGKYDSCKVPTGEERARFL